MKKGYKMEIKNNLSLIKLVTKNLIHYFNFYFHKSIAQYFINRFVYISILNLSIYIYI